MNAGLKLGIVLNTSDDETAWNAFRLANAALGKGHKTSVFLLGKGVECEKAKGGAFDIQKELRMLAENGGRVLACGTCLHLRKQRTKVCTVSSMDDLLELVENSDKVVCMG